MLQLHNDKVLAKWSVLREQRSSILEYCFDYDLNDGDVMVAFVQMMTARPRDDAGLRPEHR